MRIGEASHPGPAGAQAQDAELDTLEALTLEFGPAPVHPEGGVRLERTTAGEGIMDVEGADEGVASTQVSLGERFQHEVLEPSPWTASAAAPPTLLEPELAGAHALLEPCSASLGDGMNASGCEACSPARIDSGETLVRDGEVTEAGQREGLAQALAVARDGCAVHAANCLVGLARRIGAVPLGGDMPPALVRQRWSSFFVPLIWAAADGDADCSVLQWLQQACGVLSAPVQVGDVAYHGADAIMRAWQALSDAMRRWDVMSRSQLVAWLEREGLGSVRASHYFGQVIQEYVLNRASETHSEVLVLEAVLIQIALALGRRADILTALPGVCRPTTSQAMGGSCSAGVPEERGPASPSDTASPVPRGHLPRDVWHLTGACTWPAWQLVADNFLEWLAPYVPTLRAVPASLHDRFARVTHTICQAIYSAQTEEDAQRAFLLLLGHHRLLLWAPVRTRPRAGMRSREARWDQLAAQREFIEVRLELFERGDWANLLLHPLASKYVRQAAARDGAAAAIAADAKRQRYPALPDDGLLAVEPFCVETYGRLGVDALRLLRTARQRVAEREGGHLRGWAGTALFQRWLSLLSCELQRSLHDAALAMWGACGRLRTGPPEDVPLVVAVLPFAAAREPVG